jgi:predicted DNA binding protein
MRRIVVEISKKGFTELEKQGRFEKIKTLEILRVLRNDPLEVVFICKVEFRDPSARIEDFFPSKNVQIQLIDQENDAHIYLIKNRSQAKQYYQRKYDNANMGYIPTFEIREGKVKMSLLGDELQVKEFLESLQRRHVNFKIVSLTDAKFSSESPINCLTEKQQKAIVLAYELGYFDIPRKISSDQLAKKLNVAKSTLTVQLHRAERRLLSKILTE